MSLPPRELTGVLAIVLVCLVLAGLGFAAVARVAHVAARRLGLEPMNVLLFFGLAEMPADELARRRSTPAHRRPVIRTRRGARFYLRARTSPRT